MTARALVLLAFVAVATLFGDQDAQAQHSGRPLRIYAITFRGMTDVERGFQDYFAARRIPVQITFRDLNRDSSRMPGFIEEIRRTRPDLVYVWGTSVTLGVVGTYDAVDPAIHITDIPVVFTLVAAPVLAKIVPELKSSRRNVTGVYHVAPTEAQIRAMASYRPIKSIGILYTPTEQNSVVVVDEVREVSKRLGFQVIAKPLRLDANKRVTAEGAPEMVRELKQQKVDWLYLPPDSFLGTQT
jgi:putative ABC transport system substrate-binding protein